MNAVWISSRRIIDFCEGNFYMNYYEYQNRKDITPHERTRVAAYCRVSTDKDDQANSFENQQTYFRQYIERNPDWDLYDIFADEGISGTNTKKRKAFNRMISCAKNGDFDLIITKEISRFARNTLDSIYYTRQLKSYGVGVIFLNDNINTLDGDAELRLSIMSSIAQEESRKTSERVKWGQKRRMEQGIVFGRDMLGYDVRNGQIFINEEGAKIVRLIFHKFVNEGKGTHIIARELLDAGIKPMRNDTKWHNTVILRIIRNEKYCGDLIQKKTYTPDYLSHEKKYNYGEEEFIILKNHHEPIISREIFEKANDILLKRSLSQKGKAKHSRRYPFSGKIKCGCCGASYVARCKKRTDGSSYQAWRCLSASQYGKPHICPSGCSVGCTGPSIRNEDAIFLMQFLCQSLDFNREKIANNLIQIIESVIKEDASETKAERLYEKLAVTEEKNKKLIDLHLSGDISRNEFLTTREEYLEKITELTSLINNFENQQNTKQSQKALLNKICTTVTELVSNTTYEDELYKEILDKMLIHDKENIDIYLYFLPHKWSYKSVTASENSMP